MFGVKYPIIQAPMAGVSTPKLAAAVTNAGGIGSLGLAGKPANEVRAQIRELRALCNGPFNVNFFCYEQQPEPKAEATKWLAHLAPLFVQAGVQPPKTLMPVYEPFGGDVLEVVLQEQPPIVSFHFGAPSSNVVAELKGVGIKLMGTATSLDEARYMQQAKMDAIVAQGYEAGGHRGTFDPHGRGDERLSTLELLAELRAGGVETPIVAAGGIMDAEDALACFSNGARAVQLGTAFIGCPESAASDAYKRRLENIQITKMHNVVSGRYARGLENAFVRACEGDEAPAPPSFPYAYHAQKVLAAADKRFVNEWAGANVGRGESATAAAQGAANLVYYLAKHLK